MNFLISGASGFIGAALQNTLASKGLVRTLGRKASKKTDHFLWDPAKARIDPKALDGVDVVINLAGENVASGFWTQAKMARIRSSRVESTTLIVDSISKMAVKPKLLVNASAIGFYGNRGAEELSEDSASGSGYFPEVCMAWEGEALRAEKLGVRVVLLRFGIVLDGRGGPLLKMALPFRFGLGGVIGDGRQYVSWISLQDVLSAILFLLERSDLKGPFNLVAPNPVTNCELTSAIGKVLKRPTFLPFPAPLARLLLGSMADEMLLSSTRVLPKRLMDCGFFFQDPQIQNALAIALGRQSLK